MKKCKVKVDEYDLYYWLFIGEDFLFNYYFKGKEIKNQ